jgi:hypothetical protein
MFALKSSVFPFFFAMVRMADRSTLRGGRATLYGRPPTTLDHPVGARRDNTKAI